MIFYLAELIIFPARQGVNHATARFVSTIGLYKGDLLAFSNGQQALVSLVTGNNEALMCRSPTYRYWRRGGVAHRKWHNGPYRAWREADFHELDNPMTYYPAPPRRAQPLRRKRAAWPEVVIPVGPAAWLCHAYTEDSQA